MGIHDGHRAHMRSRFVQSGLDAFADHEVLELMLFYALPRRDTNAIAHALMERYGSLDAVLRAPLEDMQNVEGIGESAAVLLRLFPEVMKRARIRQAEREVVLSGTDKTGDYLLEQFDGERNEVIYQLCLDNKGRMLQCKRIGEGDISSANLDVRRVVENAILCGASAVILAHNHPSGLALPSRDDFAATDRVAEALKTIGVTLQDHIIVADGDYVSMAQSNFLRQHTTR